MEPKKLREVQRFLAENNCEGLLLVNSGWAKRDPNVFYVLQTDVENGLVWIPRRGRPCGVIPGFEYVRVARSSPIPVEKGPRNLFEWLKRVNKGRVAVNGAFFSLAEQSQLRRFFPGVHIKDSGDVFARVRLVKTEDELEKLSIAARLTDKIFAGFMSELCVDITEEYARKKLLSLIAEQGLEVSFDPIVASGANAAVPHHHADATKLAGFTVLDWGVKYKGYCSDITRTVFVGRPAGKDRELYARLLRVQELGIRESCPNAQVVDVERKVRKNLGKLSKFFIHRLGHSLGIEVHDVTPSSPVVFQKNMVWTVEPGVYIPNKLGIRIEDDIVITRSRARVLTKFPKELIVIK
ncbi:aminopeptidase P family protein [Candidatus Woesearchaeota archaeon]|nr:aminopeptidase P family protein [Candidatus Woesearchaeota archaeon]